jgi:nitroreductase
LSVVRTAIDRASLRDVLTAATRAPSVYNCQPWRWRADPGSGIDLFADPDRRLPATDPDGRDQLLSCGAALHHLVAAMAGAGWSAEVTRLPDPENIHHLAHIDPQGASPAPELARLAEAIPHRRTDRRRFGPEPVETALLDTLAEQAAPYQAHAHVVTGTARERLIAIISESAGLQQRQPGYPAEAARWGSRFANAGDGIPAGTAAARGAGRHGDVPMRASVNALLAQPPHGLDHDDASTLIVLSTDGDDRFARLRAGEATSAILLTATIHGLATTPLSQPLEIVETRNSITAHFAGHGRSAQLLLRLGRPQTGAPPLPPAPRRALRFVLELTGT